MSMEERNPRFFSPEEIIADFTRREDPRAGDTLEAPIPRRSIALFLVIAFSLFLLFAFRAFSLTVLQGSELLRAAERSGARTFAILPLRGAILDRNGEAVVENASTLTLVFDPLSANTASLQVRNETFARAGAILGINADELQSRAESFSNQAEARVIVSELMREKAVALAAADLPDFLRVEPSFQRTYPRGGEAFASIVGYVGDVTEEDVETQGFSPREMIGKAGVELSYDDVLRGVPGQRRVLVDARGSTRGEAVIQAPVAGSNLRLTIDAGLTDAAAAALQDALRRSGARGGALVAVDPRNGAVRALVSLPTYDAGAVSRGLSLAEYQRLTGDPRTPFLNRAIGGLYPSGSTIKPFIGAAALAERVISPTRRIDDTRGLITVTSIYDPNVSWTFRDWKAHGYVSFIDALAVSANVYFYTVGGGYGDIEGLGPERIARYLSSFGFGRTLGIDLAGEAEGRIPSPAWKEATKGEQWFVGDTYNLSIGQGDLAVTPLQLASATAAVANGGTLFQPYVLDAVMGADGTEVRRGETRSLGALPLTGTDLGWVKRGMRASVTASQGTNRALADLPLAVAAKTGTAQFGSEGKTHALVTAFAPMENPELALAIVLEGGGEGTVATRVAREVLAWYAAHRAD